MSDTPLITPERVIEAYKATSLKPIASIWTLAADNQQCACGLSAIMVNDKHAKFEELDEESIDNDVFVADALKLPTAYVAGFIYGFDGNDKTDLYVEDQANFDRGFEDGMLAWEGLIKANIISVDEQADLRKAFPKQEEEE